MLQITSLFHRDFFSWLIKDFFLLFLIKYELYSAAFSSVPLQSVLHLFQLEDGFFFQAISKQE